MRVAVVQMTSSQSVDVNLLQARQLLEQAREERAELVVLPENFACFGSTDLQALAQAEAQGGPITDFLHKNSQALGLWIVAGTLPLLPDDDSVLPYAACTVWNPQGVCQAQYNKCHLFDVDVADDVGSYRESDAYTPGEDVEVLKLPDCSLGLGVCYDVRFPEFFRKMAGVDVMALPSAFTYTTGKAHWEVLIRARAIENQCFVLAANQGGEHAAGRVTWGHSAIINPWGEVIAAHKSPTPGMAVADLDLSSIKKLRDEMPCLTHRRF